FLTLSLSPVTSLFYSSLHPPALHSFPTRRSSDLFAITRGGACPLPLKLTSSPVSEKRFFILGGCPMSISLRRMNSSAVGVRLTRLLVLLPLLLLAGAFAQAQAAGITLVQHVGKGACT